jgi:membrane protease YdiL (CAAX protease family)
VIPASRLLSVVLATQAGLALAALAGAQVAGVPLAWGRPVRDVVLGALVAVALAAANLPLIERPPAVLRALKDAVDEVLVPTFTGLTTAQIVVISAAAAIGEELFFRGFLQPVAGLAAASLAFGAAHVAGARMVAFGVWAAVMGLALGGLAVATGGVSASISAHACYDVLAFTYLGARGRRGSTMGSHGRGQ